MDLDNPSDKAESDEELFQFFIKVDQGVTETDDSDVSDKENRDTPKAKVKATKERFAKLDAFMNAHDKSSIQKKKFDDLWCNLTAELNSLGPPSFTGVEWKSKWSKHKYNKKRKREYDTESPCQRQPPPSQALGPISQDQDISSTLPVVPRCDN